MARKIIKIIAPTATAIGNPNTPNKIAVDVSIVIMSGMCGIKKRLYGYSPSPPHTPCNGDNDV